MRLHGVLSTMALVTLIGGCNKTDAPQEAALAPLLPPGHPSPVALPDPDREGGNVGRAPRRLTVAQLKSSIEVALGRPWKGLTALSQSLGQADYAFVNAESTETNLVFAKFLEDGARDVCRETAVADIAAPKAQDRILARELPDGVATNAALGDEAAVARHLTYLSTRFWGQPLSGDELTRWVGAWKAMAARAEQVKLRHQALTGICIALMTDSRFITY